MHRRHFLVVLVIGLIVGSCSASAKETYCDDRDDVRQSLDDLGSSITSLDVDQIKQSNNELKAKIDELATSANEVDGPPVSDLRSAYNQLTGLIEALGQGEGTDLRTSLLALQGALSQFTATVTSFADAYQCS